MIDDGRIISPDEANTGIDLKPSSSTLRTLVRPLTEKMKSILKLRGVLPDDGISYTIFPPLHDKIRAGTTKGDYDQIVTLFYNWCIRIGEDESVICTCDDVPDHGVPIPVPTPKPLQIFCHLRRGSTSENVMHTINIAVLDVCTQQPIKCIKKWNVIVNENKFITCIGSALFLRGVDVDSYMPARQQCILSSEPHGNHVNRNFKYATGYAKYSHSFQAYYDLVKFKTKDRVSNGAIAITPFKMIQLSQSAWHSGDFWRVYIFTIFLLMVWEF